MTSTDRIGVAITTLQPPSRILLNGQLLSILAPLPEAGSAHRVDITSALSERNLLEIVFTNGILPPHIDGGMGRPVVLEIASIQT